LWLKTGDRPAQLIPWQARVNAVPYFYASFHLPDLGAVLGRPNEACTPRAVRLGGLIHCRNGTLPDCLP